MDRIFLMKKNGSISSCFYIFFEEKNLEWTEFSAKSKSIEGTKMFTAKIDIEWTKFFNSQNQNIEWTEFFFEKNGSISSCF